MAVTSQQSELANHVASAMRVKKPPISRYWDENERSSIYILEAADHPRSGVVSYATIGLSDHPLMFREREFGARVELVGACSSSFTGFANLLSTAAFCVINSGWFCAPGIIFPDIVSMYKSSNTLSDIYFTHPFLWNESLRSTLIGDRQLAWLLAVPVSKEEAAFAKSYGAQRLEALFEEKNIDIYDLNRASVV